MSNPSTIRLYLVLFIFNYLDPTSWVRLRRLGVDSLEPVVGLHFHSLLIGSESAGGTDVFGLPTLLSSISLIMRPKSG
jgi:hypothetical protein